MVAEHTPATRISGLTPHLPHLTLSTSFTHTHTHTHTHMYTLPHPTPLSSPQHAHHSPPLTMHTTLLPSPCTLNQCTCSLPTLSSHVFSSRRLHVVPSSTLHFPASMTRARPRLCPLMSSAPEIASSYAHRSAPPSSHRMVSHILTSNVFLLHLHPMLWITCLLL